VPVKAGNIAVNTYPNPASANTVVQFNVPVNQKVRVRVTNAMGQVVVEKDIDNVKAGQNSIELNTARLSNGIYNVAIMGSNVSGASKLMVAH
jgi:flagellar hook assembly protein FlgD